MDVSDLLGDVPWITEEGFDPAQFPIDGVLKQALSENERGFHSGLTMLGSMYSHGREEAAVFLLGLLVACRDDWERRTAIVDALRGVETAACANTLFNELKRVKSSNTTRRYLAAIVKVLASMPLELVRSGFEALADDKSFSYKMRNKFKAVLSERRFRREFCR